MRSLHLRHVAGLALTLSLIHPANAQDASSSGWNSVEGLPTQTRLIVRTDKHKITCNLAAMTDDKLTCSQQLLSRAEIKSIRIPNKPRSTVIGLLLGAGIGAGAGAGIGSAVNGSDRGSYVHVSGGKSAGVGAAVGALIGIGIGALVGHSTDLFASTIYKR